MKTILVVGRKKTGKTTYVKERVKKLSSSLNFPVYVFDPNLHYAEFNQFGESKKIDNFLAFISSKKNSIIVLEEATIFFASNSKQEDLQSLMVRCRHQNNFLFLCFHSLRSLPTWCIDLADAIRISKTNDTLQVLKKFEGLQGIEDAFREVNYFRVNDRFASVFISLND